MLDVAIGLSFTYLLLSLVCTALNEWVATLARMRAKVLESAIARLVHPTEPATRKAADPILKQPEVLALSPKEDRPPSYIPKAVFVRAAVRAKVAPERSADEWGELFDATMDRATGWYKRRLQLVSLVMAIGLTLLINADTVRIAERLWRSPILRAQFLEVSRQRLADPATGRMVERYANLDDPAPDDDDGSGLSAELVEPAAPALTEGEIELMSGVTGWETDWRSLNERRCRQLEAERDAVCAAPGREAECQVVLDRIAKDPRVRVQGASLVPTDAWPGRGAFLSVGFVKVVLRRFPGWLLTIAAITVGAPFWFDTLSRFVNIRGTGKPPVDPEQSKQEAAKTGGGK
jgi:hypothetical protein